MKILVLGATGHIGSYLINNLVNRGFEVFAVFRGNKKPYVYDADVWQKVRTYTYSREDFLATDIIRTEKFDVVCDLISYSVEDVKAVTDKLVNNEFYIQIGSIWAYGNKMYLPVDEKHPLNAAQKYGKQKGEIEQFLTNLSKSNTLRCCVIHPGHISGKGWMPINPQGNLDENVFKRISEGKAIELPYLGLATLQHIHSQDLSNIICACIEKQDKANGQAFIATATKAMTMRAICESLYAYYGHTPNIQYVSWENFVSIVGESNAVISKDHIEHSPCCSCEKAMQVLGVVPEKSIMDIYFEYIENNKF